jgi:hypothetical protein
MDVKVFLDTEFTDFVRPHLISIGMVASSGQDFYAEVPYPETECSEFVRETVIPLLGKIPGASRSRHALRPDILKWFEQIRRGEQRVEVCFDYQTDWDLLIDVLGYQVPPWCSSRKIAGNINEVLLQDFYQKNGVPQHHALHDASANRYAFQETEIPSSR